MCIIFSCYMFCQITVIVTNIWSKLQMQWFPTYCYLKKKTKYCNCVKFDPVKFDCSLSENGSTIKLFMIVQPYLTTVPKYFLMGIAEMSAYWNKPSRLSLMCSGSGRWAYPHFFVFGRCQRDLMVLNFISYQVIMTLLAAHSWLTHSNCN